MKQRFQLAVVTAVAAMVTSTGVAVAMTESGTRQAETGNPPSIVEDYSYPGAGRIEASTGIKLIKGDGGIIKVSCEKGTSLIKVESSDNTIETSCYEVIDSRGWLTMEIPDVYAIQGDDHYVNATVTVSGNTKKVDVNPGEYTPVGVGNGSDHDPATLVELRVS